MYDEVGDVVRVGGEIKVALEVQGLVPLAHALVVLHRLGRQLVPPHRDSKPPAAKKKGEKEEGRGVSSTMFC